MSKKKIIKILFNFNMKILKLNINNKIDFLVWIINSYKQLEDINIYIDFDINHMHQTNNLFFYKKESEIFYNSNNKKLFILDKKNINSIKNYNYLFDLIFKLFNITNIADIYTLNISNNRKLLLTDLIKYLSSPLNNNISYKELDFICYIYS